MTWTKLDDTWTERPDVLALPRDDRLLHIEALGYCNRHLTDGALPTAALLRLGDHPAPAEAADRLVKVGLWTVEPDGWRVEFDDQRSREDVEKDREQSRFRQERSRKHRTGDHSLCDPQWCPVRRNGVSHGVTDGVTNGVSHSAPSRPDPTRPVREGREGKGLGSHARALEGRSRVAQSEGEAVCRHGNAVDVAPCAQCRHEQRPVPTVTLTRRDT